MARTCTAPSIGRRRRGTSSLALALAAGFVLGTAVVSLPATRAVAQEPSKPKKDSALEDLLEEIKSKDPAPASTSEPKPKDKPTASEKKSETKPEPKDRPAAGASSKPREDVAPKDKALDSLLEKLGESVDKPSADERPRGGAGSPSDEKEKPPAGGPGEKDQQKEKDKNPAARPDPLTGKSKELDEHLDEVAGNRRRKKDGDGEGQGPMSDLVKQMREVEKRLSQEDTGDETRKQQQQIVKKLETMIEQMKSQGQGQKQGKQSLAMKQGQQPGKNQQGQEPGNTSGNAPFTKPARHENRRSLAGGKDEWGHLPPELRQEMDNVFKEEFLPSRQELIERYYNALARKSVKRGEAQP